MNRRNNPRGAQNRNSQVQTPLDQSFNASNGNANATQVFALWRFGDLMLLALASAPDTGHFLFQSFSSFSLAEIISVVISFFFLFIHRYFFGRTSDTGRCGSNESK